MIFILNILFQKLIKFIFIYLAFALLVDFVDFDLFSATFAGLCF